MFYSEEDCEKYVLFIYMFYSIIISTLPNPCLCACVKYTGQGKTDESKFVSISQLD